MHSDLPRLNTVEQPAPQRRSALLRPIQHCPFGRPRSQGAGDVWETGAQSSTAKPSWGLRRPSYRHG